MLFKLGIYCSRQHFEIFCFKVGFDSEYILSPGETLYMKCQTLFSDLNQKIKVSSN